MLTVPEGARVESRVVDRSSTRFAHLYSLVVDVRQQRYAQRLLVADIAGTRFTQLCDSR